MEERELRKRGRPPAMSADERRRRIVAAAEKTFVSKGYAAASMDDVVRACGMSKKTVYAMFDAKERLFAEVVASSLESAPHLDGLDRSEVDAPVLLRDALRDLAAFILSPRQIVLMRLVLAESPSFPELGSIFYDVAVRQGRGMLAEVIGRVSSPACVDAERCGQMADLLVGALLGPRFFASLLGCLPTPTQSEVEQRIDWILDIVGPSLGSFKPTKSI